MGDGPLEKRCSGGVKNLKPSCILELRKNLAKRTFPVSYAYFVFEKLYREVSSTLMLLQLMKTRQTVSFDVWMLTCLISILPPRTGPQLSAFHFKCLLRVNHGRKQIRAEDHTWKIFPGHFPWQVHFASLLYTMRILLVLIFITFWNLKMVRFLFSRSRTSYKSIEFFLRLNGFFRKSLRPLLAKFPAFGGEVECVRKEGWSFHQSSKLTTYAPYNKTLFTCKSFAS